VREGGVLQVGVELLDDGVATVGLVRGDSVGRGRVGGGEEHVIPPQAEQRRRSRSAFILGSGMRRTTNRPQTCLRFSPAVNATNGASATSQLEIRLTDMTALHDDTRARGWLTEAACHDRVITRLRARLNDYGTPHPAQRPRHEGPLIEHGFRNLDNYPLHLLLHCGVERDTLTISMRVRLGRAGMVGCRHHQLARHRT
jgi:hypothetical protein